MKTALIIGIVLVVVTGGAAGLVSFRRHVFATTTPTGTPVRVEPAAKGLLIEVVNAPGEIQAKTKVQISAKVAARVAELPYKEGDLVTKGDPKANPPVPASVLVKLNSKDLEAALRLAQARYSSQVAESAVAEARILSTQSQLAASKVLLKDADRTLRRSLALFETKDVSQQEVDTAQAKYDQLGAQFEAADHTLAADRANLLVLKHQLEAAEAEIAKAREDLSYSVIESPINGKITKINTQVGELVVTGILNTPGTVLIEVADLNTMQIVARVDESSIDAVQKGQRAKIRAQAYPADVFDGVVDTVALANTAEKDGSKYYEVKVLIDRHGRQVLTGLTGDVDIETRRHENVIRVPSQAVLSRSIDDLPADIRSSPDVNPNKTFATVVYRLIDGKANATPVKVGPSDLTHTVILSGVPEGDQVIVGPYKVLETLTHGQAAMVETVNK